jgi:hypothetical protein
MTHSTRSYVERAIGSIRRECLNYVIVFDEASLRRTLFGYFSYYHRSRTHLSLDKDAPECRPAQPPEFGNVVALPEAGGLPHRHERRAAFTAEASSDWARQESPKSTVAPPVVRSMA